MTRGLIGSGPLINCGHCGKEFRTRPYKLKAGKPIFCSIECRHRGIERPDTKPCEHCGANVTRRRSAFYRGGAKKVFCNHKCAGQWRKKNPSSDRLSNYGKNAKKHRKLYGSQCFICGFDRYIEFCHIIPAAIGGTTHPSNIIVLCPNHHKLMDRELLTPEEDELLDDHLIYAWGNPLAARFGEAPELRKRRIYNPRSSGENSSEPEQD